MKYQNPTDFVDWCINSKKSRLQNIESYKIPTWKTVRKRENKHRKDWGKKLEIETVWSRIEKHEGEKFRQIRGREFVYAVSGGGVILSTTNQNIPRSEFAKAL